MKPYQISFLILFLTSCLSLQAQQIVTTGGGSMQNNLGTLSWTIGEPVNESFTTKNAAITQGMQQPNISINTIIDEKSTNYLISAYPNPTMDNVFISLGVVDFLDFKYQLFDNSGKLLLQKSINEFKCNVSLNGLTSGIIILPKIQTTGLVEKTNKFTSNYENRTEKIISGF